MQVAQPQMVAAPLTRAALFSVVTLNRIPPARTAVRSLCGDLSALLRTVGSRDLSGRLSCVMGIGSDAWDLCSAHRARRSCTHFARFARLLDFSRAVTGSQYFVPPATFLEDVSPDA